MKILFTVNGRAVAIDVEPLRRLLDILREDLGNSDVKEGCGEGECGACTVILDGEPVASCLVNAAHLEGREVLTAAGIAELPLGKILVESFDATNAVQCGFCFPGIVAASYAYLLHDGRPDLDRIKTALSGNICRCTGYQLIFESVLSACRRAAERGIK